MDRTRTVGARTSDFLSVDRTRGKGGQGESGIPTCRGGGDKASKPRPRARLLQKAPRIRLADGGNAVVDVKLVEDVLEMQLNHVLRDA